MIQVTCRESCFVVIKIFQLTGLSCDRLLIARFMIERGLDIKKHKR